MMGRPFPSTMAAISKATGLATHSLRPARATACGWAHARTHARTQKKKRLAKISIGVFAYLQCWVRPDRPKCDLRHQRERRVFIHPELLTGCFKFDDIGKQSVLYKVYCYKRSPFFSFFLSNFSSTHDLKDVECQVRGEWKFLPHCVE